MAKIYDDEPDDTYDYDAIKRGDIYNNDSDDETNKSHKKVIQKSHDKTNQSSYLDKSNISSTHKSIKLENSKNVIQNEKKSQDS